MVMAFIYNELLYSMMLIIVPTSQNWCELNELKCVGVCETRAPVTNTQ